MLSDLEFSLSDKEPNSLFDACIKSIINNLNIVTTIDPTNWCRLFKEDVVLPEEVCERFLNTYQKYNRLHDDVANVFRDRTRTHLKSIKLHNARISDDGFRCLMEHRPRELHLVQCDYSSRHALDIINSNSQNLVSLIFGPRTYVLSEEDIRGRTINAPKLKYLSIRGQYLTIFPVLLLKRLTQLTHLDLSDCTTVGSIWALNEMKHLISLVLHNVYWSKDVEDWIATLTSLKRLDISQSNEKQGKYNAPNDVLTKLVTNLPNLESLDISGTNLAGSGAAVATEGASGEVQVRCDIPGLVSRVNNPLQFLGLYGTHHSACKRHDIPALTISGDANEEQILTAATAYMQRPVMLIRVLNHMYYLFRFENNVNVARALSIILDAMEMHVSEKHVQISGSATLFYIVKGPERANIGIRLKHRIISALLSGMAAHLGDDTMMRNGCLTLCQFKIPADVLFEYERMVIILLNGVADVNQEGFVRRIAIYLLNSLACQVDGHQKRFLGSHGAISKMLSLISDRVTRSVCDDVLEVAWSTMWNVTDETPQNCQRFLENHGMEFFIACLRSFPEKEELLRNMMGLLGNVAEVGSLRPHLMNKRFLQVFYELLDSSSDGIEVSYNAAGVLAHMASDGPAAWTVDTPRRGDVLERVASAIARWDLSAERNINYRSFGPILGLLGAYHTPQCQHWAAWALANLTTVYPSKYCSLVEAEGGLRMLHELLDEPEPYECIKMLAKVVIVNCQRTAAQPTSHSPQPGPDNNWGGVGAPDQGSPSVNN